MWSKKKINWRHGCCQGQPRPGTYTVLLNGLVRLSQQEITWQSKCGFHAKCGGSFKKYVNKNNKKKTKRYLCTAFTDMNTAFSQE